MTPETETGTGTTTRVNVRLEGEELEAVDLLCARWRVGRAEALRRAGIEVARWMDYNSRISALEAVLRAEIDHRTDELSGRIDHVWAALEERAPVVPDDTAPVGASPDEGPDQPPATEGSSSVANEASPAAVGVKAEDLARRPGQGRPLAPLVQLVEGDRLEIDVPGA